MERLQAQVNSGRAIGPLLDCDRLQSEKFRQSSPSVAMGREMLDLFSDLRDKRKGTTR